MYLMQRRYLMGIVAGVICAVLLTGVVGVPAQAGTLSDLRKKLSSYSWRESQARKELRTAKQEQQAAQDRLVSAQQELEQAQARLLQSEAELRKTKQEIAETERELAETAARLGRHQEQMQQRLLAAYRAGEPQYLEVVFCATSFADFVDRAEFMRRIAASDESLLTKLVSEKQAFERRKAELEAQKARQEDLRAQIIQQRSVVRQRKAVADQALRKATEDRAETERLLRQMEWESQQIEQMIARLQRGGGLRYSGNWSGAFKCPIWSSYYISSGYGWRIHPITHTRRFHDGVDLACPAGMPIHAGDKGLVLYAGWQGVYGKTIIVDHGSGISTMYAHCSRFAVSKGQTVKQGQVIGYVGSTGWSTGPHLHFGVRKYGKPINPMKF